MSQTLNLYPIDYPFETLIDRVSSNKLILDPDFQRKYKWDKDGNERSSKFIESCLMRIPLPACYFAEDENNNHIVIDGVQRITTINRFFNDEFALEGLTVLKDLEGKKFSELNKLKSELETTTIRCIVLRKENPPYLIQEIFARLNQGSVALSPQEIRHAVYPGSFDELLQKLSKIDLISNFRVTENSSIIKNSREDEELVLRFFALNNDLEDYEGNLKVYLDNYMQKHQKATLHEINEKDILFNTTLNKCKDVFGEDIFKNLGSKTNPQQGVVIYDLQMWMMTQFNTEKISQHKEDIYETFKSLVKGEEYKKTTSGGTLNKTSIIKRRNLWKELLKDILD